MLEQHNRLLDGSNRLVRPTGELEHFSEIEKVVARDHAVRVQKKNGEKRALLRRADLDRPAVVADFQ